MSKCEIFTSQIEYFEHLFIGTRSVPNETKGQAIIDLEPATNFTEEHDM